MSIFLTGSTGYLGSYVLAGLLQEHADRIAVLVRADSEQAARERLWKSLQLHMGFERFLERVERRVDIVLGDLTRPRFGLDEARHRELVHGTDSVLHVAASLNRKSAKSCFNVNLRGTLEVIKLARAAQEHHGLRRFSDVSTVAVAGKRAHETVTEAASVDWSRSDYDPYARTKKFCEHMVHELLPDVPSTVFRPSIVLGDSRFPDTTQFDMARAFATLAQMPLLPFEPAWRLDIVPADFVGRAIVSVHQHPRPAHDTYHLSSGQGSQTYARIVDALRAAGHSRRHVFVPRLLPTFERAVDTAAATPRSWGVALPASLFKVFLPYLTYDTVFDNTRICEHLGDIPRPFGSYAAGLLRFVLENDFNYPYLPWPQSRVAA